MNIKMVEFTEDHVRVVEKALLDSRNLLSTREPKSLPLLREIALLDEALQAIREAEFFDDPTVEHVDLSPEKLKEMGRVFELFSQTKPPEM